MYSVNTSILYQLTGGPLTIKVDVAQSSLAEGRTMKLTCTVTGSNPPALVHWYRHRKKITDADIEVSSCSF